MKRLKANKANVAKGTRVHTILKIITDDAWSDSVFEAKKGKAGEPNTDRDGKERMTRQPEARLWSTKAAFAMIMKKLRQNEDGQRPVKRSWVFQIAARREKRWTGLTCPFACSYRRREKRGRDSDRKIRRNDRKKRKDVFNGSSSSSESDDEERDTTRKERQKDTMKKLYITVIGLPFYLDVSETKRATAASFSYWVKRSRLIEQSNATLRGDAEINRFQSES